MLPVDLLLPPGLLWILLLATRHFLHVALA
jgi:hypothetical protein